MRRDPAALASTQFDLVIIGGGIHGLAAAYDAAQRGLSVALVERGDFGSEASGNHLKTVHGGLRYLQSADFVRMRESIVERRRIACIAPHLVTLLPYLVPTYRALTKSRLAMRGAFMMDRLVGLDRNAGVPPPLRIPPSRVVSRRECVRLFPGARTSGLTGGAIWHDYQMRDTSRLTLSFAIAADRLGARLANYVEATSPLVRGGRVEGVRVRDVVGGGTFDIRARSLLNAAGAGAGRLAAALGRPEPPVLLKALNVVTTRPLLGPALGSRLPDGRMLFLVPWQGRMMVGTSQTANPCGPDDAGVSEAELDAFLIEIETAFPGLGLTADEVSLVHRGLVAGERTRDGRLTLRGHVELRDHARDGVAGAFSLVGVKYTTGRGVAEMAVTAITTRLGRDAARCRTADVPLPGGEAWDLDLAATRLHAEQPGLLNPEVSSWLVRSYGSDTNELTASIRHEPSLAAPIAGGVPAIGAQVVHAVRNEMACHLADIVMRRVPIGDAGYPGDDAVEACARLAGAELGWSGARRAEEMEAARAIYAPARLNPLRPTSRRTLETPR